MRYSEFIRKYYADNAPLTELLLLHSRQVADRALSIARSRPSLGVDPEFIEEAAMLHDIGVGETDAPGIHCYGSAPYLMHGYLGAELMRKEGKPEIARVCERHTGTGLTAEQIRRNNLPLPPGDYRPQTMEEKLICYADKFYSKSHPERVRSIQETADSLEKFGHEGVEIFLGWAKIFEL